MQKQVKETDSNKQSWGKTLQEFRQMEWSQTEKTWEFYFEALKVFYDLVSGEKGFMRLKIQSVGTTSKGAWNLQNFLINIVPPINEAILYLY